METLPLTQRGETLHIEEFKDAVKVVKLTSHGARRTADLALHKLDLEFARDTLLAINAAGAIGPTAQEALWRSSIIHFAKCFGKGSRTQLCPKKVYRSLPAAALEWFYHFKKIRDKHIAHDVNAYMQALPGAIVNDGTKGYKIEKIISFIATNPTLDQHHYKALFDLVEAALNWVIEEHDKWCDQLTQELEKEEHSALLSRPALTYTPATIADVGLDREAAAE